MTAQTGFGATQCPYCGASVKSGHICPRRPLDADVDDLGFVPAQTPITMTAREYRLWILGNVRARSTVEGMLDGKPPRDDDIFITGYDDEGNVVKTLCWDATKIGPDQAARAKEWMGDLGASTVAVVPWAGGGQSHAAEDAYDYLSAAGLPAPTVYSDDLVEPQPLCEPGNLKNWMLGCTDPEKARSVREALYEAQALSNQERSQRVDDLLSPAAFSRERRRAAGQNAQLAIALQDPAEQVRVIRHCLYTSDSGDRDRVLQHLYTACASMPDDPRAAGMLMATSEIAATVPGNWDRAGTLRRRAERIDQVIRSRVDGAEDIRGAYDKLRLAADFAEEQHRG